MDRAEGPITIICGTFCRVPKKDGGLRPVYNIVLLNHYVQYHHFKMEILSMVKATLLKNDYMVKIDRKDAYQCIPVHTQDRAFMRFQWVVQLYQYAALPFGLASAPRQFTKIMKPIVSLLRRVGVRLLICSNDIIIFNQCPNRQLADMNSLVFCYATSV